jgi:hypothetical protein
MAYTSQNDWPDDGDGFLSVFNRRALLANGVAVGDARGAGRGLNPAHATTSSEPGARPLDARAEAKKIAFDRVGSGETILPTGGPRRPRTGVSDLGGLGQRRTRNAPSAKGPLAIAIGAPRSALPIIKRRFPHLRYPYVSSPARRRGRAPYIGRL